MLVVIFVSIKESGDIEREKNPILLRPSPSFRVYRLNFHFSLILAMSLVCTRCLINDTITENARKVIAILEPKQTTKLKHFAKRTATAHYLLYWTWLMIALLLMVCLCWIFSRAPWQMQNARRWHWNAISDGAVFTWIHNKLSEKWSVPKVNAIIKIHYTECVARSFYIVSWLNS